MATAGADARIDDLDGRRSRNRIRSSKAIAHRSFHAVSPDRRKAHICILGSHGSTLVVG